MMTHRAAPRFGQFDRGGLRRQVVGSWPHAAGRETGGKHADDFGPAGAASFYSSSKSSSFTSELRLAERQRTIIPSAMQSTTIT